MLQMLVEFLSDIGYPMGLLQRSTKSTKYSNHIPSLLLCLCSSLRPLIDIAAEIGTSHIRRHWLNWSPHSPFDCFVYNTHDEIEWAPLSHNLLCFVCSAKTLNSKLDPISSLDRQLSFETCLNVWWMCWVLTLLRHGWLCIPMISKTATWHNIILLQIHTTFLLTRSNFT